VEDVIERKLYEARIQQQANYDTLTGPPIVHCSTMLQQPS
jgi:hypothetical protein